MAPDVMVLAVMALAAMKRAAMAVRATLAPLVAAASRRAVMTAATNNRSAAAGSRALAQMSAHPAMPAPRAGKIIAPAATKPPVAANPRAASGLSVMPVRRLAIARNGTSAATVMIAGLPAAIRAGAPMLAESAKAMRRSTAFTSAVRRRVEGGANPLAFRAVAP